MSKKRRSSSGPVGKHQLRRERKEKKKKKEKKQTPSASERKLTPEELADIAERIKASKPGDDSDLYWLIETLGWKRATQYRDLVEPFLYYPSDMMVVHMAIEVFFKWWSEGAKPYAHYLKEFIRGVSWDDRDKSLRRNAIYYVGYFLEKNPERELFQMLLSRYLSFHATVVEAERQGEPNGYARYMRDLIFEALAIGVGKMLEMFHLRVTGIDQGFRDEVIKEVREIMKRVK